jgi:hypothetical protein
VRSLRLAQGRVFTQLAEAEGNSHISDEDAETPVFLACIGKPFSLEAKPSCWSSFPVYPSFRPRSDWVVAGVGLQCCRRGRNKPTASIFMAENLGCREIVKVWGRECKVGHRGLLPSCSCGLKLPVWGLYKPLKKRSMPFNDEDTKKPARLGTNGRCLSFLSQHLLSCEIAFSVDHSTYRQYSQLEIPT